MWATHRRWGFCRKKVEKKVGWRVEDVRNGEDVRFSVVYVIDGKTLLFN